MDVENGDSDAQACSGTTVGLLKVGPPGLFEPFDLSRRIRQPDFGELRADVASAALEDAEDVGWGNDLPCGQRVEYG